MRLWVIVLFAGLAWAQAPPFPPDTKAATRADAELLEAVCPGMVTGGAGIKCESACPRYTGFGNDFKWSSVAVTRGHFLSPASDDAVLWMEGCEPHSENFGGSVLLTRDARQWSMLWYKAGIETSHCHRLTLSSGRDVLVCFGVSGGQGYAETELYLEDLLNPVATLMAEEGEGFLSLPDNTRSCGANGEDPAKPQDLVLGAIDKVEFLPRRLNGAPVIAVTARAGTRKTTPQEVKECFANHAARLPQTASYRIEFIYDGHDYHPAPESAEAMRGLQVNFH